MQLNEERDFVSYLRHLHAMMPQILIFIAASDTPVGSYFTPEYSLAMHECLGVKADLLGKYRLAYLAVINRGTVLTEQMPATTDGFLRLEVKNQKNEVEYLVISGSFDSREHRKTAVVEHNGENLALNRRGLNFVVLDADNYKLLDSCVVDSYIETYVSHRYTEATLFKNYMQKRGCQVIFVRRPQFPAKNLSPNEEFINNYDLHGTCDRLLVMANLDVLWRSNHLALKDFFPSMEDIHEVDNIPPSFVNMYNVRRYNDTQSKYVNTVGGLRVTYFQPQKYERQIFIVGPCHVFGQMTSDDKTIESYLQKNLNEKAPQEKFIVWNYGFQLSNDMDRVLQFYEIMETMPTKTGDIIIFMDDYGTHYDGFPFLDLGSAAERPHKYGEVFYCLDHFTPAGYHLIADKIFDYLNEHKFFPCEQNAVPTLLATEETVGNFDENKLQALAQYKNKLKEIYRTIKPVVGAIVMNCNPFTLGHRYLVEQAYAQCDRLIIFVVEEDKSVFPFADRIKLVQAGVADLPNVTVIGSGQFIISTSTFTEYFNKEKLQDVTIDPSLDLTIFAKDIAPCMDISVRFVGEEPFDNVTRQYNEAMRSILTQYGITVTEIPRREIDGMPISASRVRELIDAHDWTSVAALVPETTLRYLRENF